MDSRAAEYADVRIKRNTLRIIQGFFKAGSPEEALDKLALWMKERESESDFMRKHQGKGAFGKFMDKLYYYP